MNGFSVKMDDMNELHDNSVTFDPSDRGFVYAVARRIVRSETDAEDVTQDALLLAYRYRDRFRGDSRYRTWLYRIASTTALGHLRRQRRSREQLEDAPRDLATPDPSPEQEAASREELVQLERAIAELPATYRDVLVLRAFSHSEQAIAKRLGISVGNVKIRTHRARARLRAA